MNYPQNNGEAFSWKKLIGPVQTRVKELRGVDSQGPTAGAFALVCLTWEDRHNLWIICEVNHVLLVSFSNY